MIDTPTHTAGDWQFDHLTLAAAPSDPAIRSLVALLGLAPGARPPFPFGGAWFYRGDAPLLHVIDAPAGSGARLDHIAFRGDRPLDAILPAVAATGLPFHVMRIPETATAQVFVQLAERVVLELDVPEGSAGGRATDYSQRHPE